MPIQQDSPAVAVAVARAHVEAWSHWLRAPLVALATRVRIGPATGSRLGVVLTRDTQGACCMPQFQSFNFRDRFIRHRNFQGELSRRRDGGPEADFSFALLNRGKGRVSLRSVNFQDRFLRHRDFRILLEGPAGPRDELFKLDSTFFFERGLADPKGVSFRSVNFPDRYLRHRDFLLFLEPKDSPNLVPDATFFRTELIDHGTELNPVDE
jgi:hypothetical protein